MRLHPLPGTDLQLSTFCCGLGDLFDLPENESDRLLDSFVEAGGNFFDTAHCYSFWLPGGGGLSETRIADYLRRRGCKEVVIATKGGHPSAPGYRTVDQHLSAPRIGADIDDSLGRLQRDTLDLYYLHRDDERMPVGEIMEILNAEIRRGRIRYMGASNWSLNRLAEARAYSAAHQLRSFVISQPCWSLAVPRKDTGFAPAQPTGWQRRNELPIAPYSPTARGYFAQPSPATHGDYATLENQERWKRVGELAAARQVTRNEIALAWLLNQPFPVFPILGTKQPDHLRAALGAEAIHFTAQEVEWLDTGN